MGASTWTHNPGDADPSEKWVQLARPSRSSGFSMTHHIAGPEELLDVVVPGFCVSLCRAPTATLEYRDHRGRWQAPVLKNSMVTFIPAGSQISVRWNGMANAINLMVDPLWLTGPGDDRRPRSSGRPHHILQDKLTSSLIDLIRNLLQQAHPMSL